MSTTPALPDPFLMTNGTPVRGRADWPRRRREILERLVRIEYGGLPPSSSGVTAEELHTHQVERYGNARHSQYRIHTGPGAGLSFVLDLLVPSADTSIPVILNGDGCWRTLTDEIIQLVLHRGYALAQFNRVELAPDIYTNRRDSGLYLQFPGEGFGALAAWAWGFHRCVDFLVTLDFLNPAQIAVTGHSRGGKAALLAGATDERIALTCPNGSGCGGAGCFRYLGQGSESLADIMKPVPYWFGAELKEYIGREVDLPFDQHFLKALVAPRSLLCTEALGDLWANPTGTWQTSAAAAEVYRFLSAGERIGIHYREGDHAHTIEDWNALLAFADWQLRGEACRMDFSANPFPGLPRPWLWRAPAV
jgi:dienelactone hydrolase